MTFNLRPTARKRQCWNTQKLSGGKKVFSTFKEARLNKQIKPRIKYFLNSEFCNVPPIKSYVINIFFSMIITMIFLKTILIVLSPINTKAKIKRDTCSFLTGFIVIVF